ncbi:nucleotidyltransferase family protein [Acetobacter sp. TBRC 12305]|uniref:Nucleotidyltransferase family protein n=1 Tax=Acetobacter garciniae TaxID=2817435 RepID=A0A939HJZ8_9PROT|nr:nucleotidyltransferase family protein [Acetobacter garciniae]MBO1325828.1 nucleotidyltransferase family protein [Acetobacter garciniae]MBX0345728.1 nucleotidyltransferase family protein [Acetobacter garciniae]
MNAATRPVTALILAGSRPGKPDPVAVASGVAHKALFPVGGVPMIARVIAALRATPAIGRIVVCTNTPDGLAPVLPPDVAMLPSSPEGPSASVLAALGQYGTPLLVTTADNALLQAGWVEEFLARIQPGSDMAAAVATEETVRRDVPNTQRTYIRLADMAFSGCNMFLFKTAISAQVATLWREVEKNRKHPLRIAWTLGPLILLRALTGRLTRKALYARIHTLTGAQAELVPLSDGRAAVDVDKPADMVLAERLAAGLPPVRSGHS